MKILKKLALPTLFILFATAFALAPKMFCTAFIQGLMVWANNVLPVLLPFCLLAPPACKALPQKGKLTRFLFGQSADGLFATSLVCGYPVGAKLVADSGADNKTAVALSAFCSTPGPIFLLATVCPLLENAVASAILVGTQLVACILNGLIFRSQTSCITGMPNPTRNAKNFSETLTDSVLSVLTVGALIGIAYMISYAVKSILPDSFADSLTAAFFCGLLEMTSGVFFVTAATTDTLAQTVLCSTLLGFGGIGILLQSMSFLSRCKVRSIDYLKTKLTQSSLCAIISYLLCKLFL